jgi:hypothetical protein
LAKGSVEVMKNVHSIVLKILGVLLLTAVILKGWQLLTEPLANKDIWSYRPLLIFTVEFELALAIWLLSGLFKKAAWLASVAVFSLFSLITLYKALSGADSCGCFGAVKVNPWLTFFAIDLPAVIALLIFRPSDVIPSTARNPQISSCHSERSEEPAQRSATKLSTSPLWPLSPKITATALMVLLVIAISTSVLALNKPANTTSSYEVLEPETWIGNRLPILAYIDIGQQLEKGNWLVLFYHYDCPDCQKAISKYERVARDNEDSKNFPKVAFIEVPPYGRSIVNASSTYTVGKLSNIKEWFITTPAVILLTNSTVRNSWEQKAPDFDAVVKNIAMLNKSSISNSIP